MSGVGKTVLIVDDEPSIRLLCRVNLEFDGYRVLEAATLRDARSILEADQVDVILLDVHVGRELGYDLLDELRDGESPVAVVLLSGSATIDDRGEDADAVIAKPFELEELASTVAHLATGLRNGERA